MTQISTALFSGGPMNGRTVDINGPIQEYQFPIARDLKFSPPLDDVAQIQIQKAVYIRTGKITTGHDVVFLYEFRGIFPDQF